ncbi:hypothetical protein HanXRQr2_Chr01g0011271 [Helianthus annuus]|uniref:Uncharacterized protein n=1 Tax=Helianthus annuus TaxID=4232 RepID=A0A9K3JTQ5_HELAN|nr:uncharacterized protein LOC110927508 [Helianthus annuus]XP_022026789.1 uncharacterized protein LOC110927508 [Helianthus annuus]KAF5821220.1 hypothetical protein HanXRQr2_Chr01g0011271 [Helianthus annuus]
METHADFIPLETESESESGSTSSESCGSSHDIVPRIFNAATCGSDEGIEKLGVVYNEVRIHGVSLKEIRWYEADDGLKIELSVGKLKKKRKQRVGDGSFGWACESVGDNVTNESVKRCEEVCSRRRRVAAVRSYPPGCGRVMKIA